MALQVPNELVTRIIKLSLPRQSCRTFPERSTLLRTFALVSHAWCSIAQAELSASPVIRDPESARLFCEVLKTQAWRADRIRLLRFGPDVRRSAQYSRTGYLNAGEMVPTVFAACPKLQALEIHGVFGQFQLEWLEQVPGALTLPSPDELAR